MKLPSAFQFSQSSLQDYVHCPRRFQLRYVLMQPWPALVAEPAREVELRMRLGAEFHHLAHQYHLGLEPGLLEASIHDEMLARWWQSFVQHPPRGLPDSRWSESVVSAPLNEHRMMAKFDLLAVEPGRRFVVVDWKTSPTKPSHGDLARRIQTRVYRFLAVEAGASFNQGQRPSPAQVEMLYWFADHDGRTERFPYDSAQHAADGFYLCQLVAEIAGLDQPIWDLASDDGHCRFCNYRSLCDRSVVPGFASELEDDLDLVASVIDLEMVPEIEF